MAQLNFPTSAQSVANHLGAQLIGDPDLQIEEVRGLSDARPGSLSFFANRAYAGCLERLDRVAVLTREELVQTGLPLTYLVVANPQEAFAQAIRSLEKPVSWQGISPLASISGTAVLAENVHVGPFAVIGDGVVIGSGTYIYPHATIGTDTRIGEACVIRENVTIYEGSILGNRVKVHAGTVIGCDGFGYFSGSAAGHIEMPQIGRVVIEDDVRIGSNATIDRATLHETRLRRGAKLDDQVHVGHNGDIGEDTLLCAQVGLGGSVIIESEAVLAGQVGVGHGVRVGKGAQLGGQTGASTNVPAGESVFLTPALPLRETLRIVKYWRKLPDIWSRLKRLETTVEALKNG